MTASPKFLKNRFRNHGSYDGQSSWHSDDERSLGEVVGDLTRHTQELVRGELELFKAELTEKGKKAGSYAAMAAGAALCAVITLFFVGHAIAWALATVMPSGLAYLLVALLYGVVAVGLGLAAKKGFEKTSLAPTDSIETAKEDLKWVKTHS